METKLTLRLDAAVIGRAKKEAKKRGTSVSKMVADYFLTMSFSDFQKTPSLPPATASLLGSLKGKRADKEDYRKHLEDKYL